MLVRSTMCDLISAGATCVVLPSYREGTPRTLLEAAAMAKPIVTTDAPGCREVVDDGVNGFLCRVRSADDLAGQIIKMATFSPEKLMAMGQASRRKMETEFDERIVFDRYRAAIETAILKRRR